MKNPVTVIAVLFALLLIARTASAGVWTQPGVPNSLIVTAPLAGGGAMVVQPGTNQPPTFVVPLGSGSGMIIQPQTPQYQDNSDDDGSDSAATDESSSDGSDSGDTEN